jgi:hypothetical protein
LCSFTLPACEKHIDVAHYTTSNIETLAPAVLVPVMKSCHTGHLGIIVDRNSIDMIWERARGETNCKSSQNQVVSVTGILWARQGTWLNRDSRSIRIVVECGTLISMQ